MVYYYVYYIIHTLSKTKEIFMIDCSDGSTPHVDNCSHLARAPCFGEWQICRFSQSQ